MRFACDEEGEAEVSGVRCEISAMFLGAVEAFRAEERKALRNPGPHHPHLRLRHHTGAKTLQIHTLIRAGEKTDTHFFNILLTQTKNLKTKTKN